MRSQHLFLDSAAGTVDQAEEPAAWTAHFEPGLVQCAPDERLVVTLKTFYTVFDWAWVRDDDAFELTGITGYGDDGVTPIEVPLPKGNPTVHQVAAAVTAYCKGALPSGSTMSCAYQPGTNRFVIKADRPLGLRFPDLRVAAVLGFTRLEVPSDIDLGLTDLISDAPVRPLPVDTVRIDLQGVVAAGSAPNATNLAREQVAPCRTLAVIPVTARPWTLLSWENQGDAFATVLTDRTLTRLTFLARSWEGVPLTQLGRYFLVLRVDHVRVPSPSPRADPALGPDAFMVALMDVLRELRTIRGLHAANLLT